MDKPSTSLEEVVMKIGSVATGIIFAVLAFFGDLILISCSALYALCGKEATTNHPVLQHDPNYDNYSERELIAKALRYAIKHYAPIDGKQNIISYLQDHKATVRGESFALRGAPGSSNYLLGFCKASYLKFSVIHGNFRGDFGLKSRDIRAYKYAFDDFSEDEKVGWMQWERKPFSSEKKYDHFNNLHMNCMGTLNVHFERLCDEVVRDPQFFLEE